MAYPTPHVDIEQMLADRETHMSILDSTADINQIQFNSTRIKVDELISYYYLNNENRFEGLRFWPAIMDYSLVFPIISVSAASSDANAFCLLEETSYLEINNGFSNVVSKALAMRCLNEYKAKVFIDAQNQANIIAINSRYVNWDDIIALFQANILGFIETEPSTFVGYSLKIEQGYVAPELAEKFYSQYGIGENNTDYIGYTVMLSLYDPAGVQLINTAAQYERKNFVGRYVEAGIPCPPKCD